MSSEWIKNYLYFLGYDKDPEVISYAKRNIKGAGFCGFIQVQERPISDFALPEACLDKPGPLLLTHPMVND